MDSDINTLSTGQLNYFNYFTEVEDEFVRRRGKPLLISPMDWALVESWKDAGIPLHVVLRAINSSFDAYDARARKYRKVNSIFYCQQEVESQFAEYRLAQVGAGGQPAPAEEGSKPSRNKKRDSVLPKDLLNDFFDRSEKELQAALEYAGTQGKPVVTESMTRALLRLKEVAEHVRQAKHIDEELVERDLDGIDYMLLDSFREACAPGELTKIEDEAESQLKSYRSKMDKAMYEQTRQNFISRRLRERHKTPRLSLFYI